MLLSGWGRLCRRSPWCPRSVALKPPPPSKARGRLSPAPRALTGPGASPPRGGWSSHPSGNRCVRWKAAGTRAGGNFLNRLLSPVGLPGDAAARTSPRPIWRRRCRCIRKRVHFSHGLSPCSCAGFSRSSAGARNQTWAQRSRPRGPDFSGAAGAARSEGPRPSKPTRQHPIKREISSSRSQGANRGSTSTACVPFASAPGDELGRRALVADTSAWARAAEPSVAPSWTKARGERARRLPGWPRSSCSRGARCRSGQTSAATAAALPQAPVTRA